MYNVGRPFRNVTKQCRRHPIVFLSIVALVTFLYVYTVGRDDWEKHKVDPFPLPAQEETDASAKDRTGQDAQRQSEPSNVTHDFAYDQRVRLERIKEVCASSDRPPGKINSLITRANLTYCVIPRSSNTFWLQIYRYLNYDFLEENPRSPFDLDVSQVHNRPFARTRQHNWRRLTEADRKVILASRIFLSVQDPYMRLWTTYLNSLVLPDLWSTVGIKIEAKRIRRPTVIKKRVSTVGLCGADVTFSEFVDYALESYEAEYDTFYHQCDPCQLSPTYIVKAETAWRDNQHVLGHFNLSWVVDAPDFQEEMTKRYIQNTIKSNFARMRDPLVKTCVVHGDIARKVWKIFTLQGLIPEDVHSLKWTTSFKTG